LDPSLIVPPADPSALGSRLRSAAAGELPGRVAARRFAEQHGWPQLAARHLDLYKRLVAGDPDRRLRVVFLDHVARLSGGEIAILRLLPHLQGVNAHVILAEQGLLAERLTQAGISVEVLPLSASTRDLRRDAVRIGPGSPAAALQTLGYAARLAVRLRRLRPDLVHTNSLKSGVYGGLAARAAGVPLLWHLRDRLAADYLPAPAVRMMRGAVAALADGVVANSASTLETLPRRARERGLVIPDSVEAAPRAPARNPDAVTFGMLGRIAPWKGQDLFLRAFAAAFPGGRERAVLVGEPLFGEHDYERELHSLAAELGIEQRVEFRGFREDIWSELASFDVLVHASVIPEPFGQVVIEGMAAGLAVVAADEGGPADVIDDGRTGRLFTSRDQLSLAATMRALRDDPALRRRLGEAARGAAGEYHPGVLGARLERAYEDLLARS
jgi:glycosyltransferase involved in cell wall biosynthesis